MRNDFETRNGHHGGWHDPLCMTLTKKVCLSNSGRCHSMDGLLCTETSHLTRLVLVVRIPRFLLAGGENTDEQAG